MKIAVISDLHLASSAKVDNFGKQQEEIFISFLEYLVSKKYNKLVVCGDMYELWQGRGWTEYSRYKKIRKRYVKLHNKLVEVSMEGLDIIILPGNHDYLLHTKFGMDLYHFVSSDKLGKIMFLHGHQFDDNYKSKWSWVKAKLATSFWGWVESVIGTKKSNKILNSIEKYIDKLSVKSKQPASKLKETEPNVDQIYANLALKEARKHSAKVVIMGHTHKVYSVTMSSKAKQPLLYFNSGTLIDGKFDWISINTNTGKIQTLHLQTLHFK